MNKTGIDYLDRVWNFYTGCKHGKSVCPCADKCWARSMANRFHRTFEPTLHPERLLEPLSLKKSSRIGVCFTGDLFGDWVNENQVIVANTTPRYYAICGSLKFIVQEVMHRCPHNQFFFLTKAPWNLKKWGEFPDNAWVGATVCNQQMLKNTFMAFRDVQSKNKWLSIEPLTESLNELHYLPLLIETIGISWVVIGGWSGGKNPPRIEWIKEITDACDKSNIPVFIKNNLKLGIPRQELPF